MNFEERLVEREACMESIPLSVMIIHDVVDQIVRMDELKQKQAKQRALKLAV